MKKIISLVLTFVLAVGIGISFNFYQVKTSAGVITATPENDETVNLIAGDMYDFCANYAWKDIEKYYTQYADKYTPKPLEIKWNKVNGAKSYEVLISTNEDMTDPKRIVTMDTETKVNDLFAGYDYYYKVSTEANGEEYSTEITHIKTADLPRTIYVDSVGNTRDFGGRYTKDKKYRVKQGIIYRGGNVDKISDTGKNRLLNDFNIKTDMDLRGQSKVSPLGGTTKLVAIPSVMYRGGLLNEYNWPTLKKEVMTFANPNNFPIYMHCAIGRDRTGTLCFLLGALVGMDEDDICRDYQLSFFANISNADIKDPVKYTQNNYNGMLNFIKYYDNGSLQSNVMEYMRECLNISQYDLNRIRTNLLTPDPDPIPEPKVATPAKVKLKSVKNKKKKSIVIKFYKAKNAKGYQVWWARKKNSKIASTKYTTSQKFTIKKLKKKKKYYIKVRGYNINGHKYVYGPFSKTKKVKIRK